MNDEKESFMTAVLLRRRGLGRGMDRALAEFDTTVVPLRSDRAWPDDVNLVFRWGCTANTPNGSRVINTAEAIHRVNDKRGFRQLLSERAPAIVPETVFEYIPQNMEGEWVVRPRSHAQGRNLHVVEGRDTEAFNRALRACGEGWYAGRLIQKVAEFRVMFFQGRVAWVANKTPGNPDDVAWNVARGGRFDNVRFGAWPLRVIQAAHQAFQLSGLDFGGVDVMTDAAGTPYILEINSAPSQTSPYRQECTVKCLNYIVANGNAQIFPGTRGEWRDYIHPAISEEARIG